MYITIIPSQLFLFINPFLYIGNVTNINTNTENSKSNFQEVGIGRRKLTKQRLSSTSGATSVLKQSK